MITAILRFNGFEKKIKMLEVFPEYREILRTRLSISSLQEVFSPDNPNRAKVMVFEWRKQLKRFTHEYTLKEII